MACGLGLPDAEDCAADHWSRALDGRRERGGQWRANCPVPGCRSRRSLEYDAPGKHVRWRSFCRHHDKEAVRPYLVKLVGLCMPRGAGPKRNEELIALAKTPMPPTSLRLAGMGTYEALDVLGVRREHRSRVIAQRTNPGAGPQVRGG